MAGGVPIKAPVAGIAMGLISDVHTVLTDIRRSANLYLWDMDFVAVRYSRRDYSPQMDIKIQGMKILTWASLASPRW